MSRTKYRTTPDPRYPNLGHNCAKCGIWLYTEVGEDWFCPSCIEIAERKMVFPHDTPLWLKILIFVAILSCLFLLAATVYRAMHPRVYTCTYYQDRNLIDCR